MFEQDKQFPLKCHLIKIYRIQEYTHEIQEVRFT